jgi:hypothetical protein
LAGLPWACGPGKKDQPSTTETDKTTDTLVHTGVDAGEQGLDIEEVPTHAVPENPILKSLHNIRYSFKINIPRAWTALDKSGNGDGFAISVPGNPVEILVYGEAHEKTLAEFYESGCTEVTDYLFDNGSQGKHCVQGGTHSFWMVNERYKINVYIKDLNSLSPKDAEMFDAMAKSLSFFEPSAKSS